MVIVAIIEPPVAGDQYWLVSAPAVRYAAQGLTRASAVKNFEEGLEQAVEWAEQAGPINPKRQPDLVEYEL